MQSHLIETNIPLADICGVSSRRIHVARSILLASLNGYDVYLVAAVPCQYGDVCSRALPLLTSTLHQQRHVIPPPITVACLSSVAPTSFWERFPEVIPNTGVAQLRSWRYQFL